MLREEERLVFAAFLRKDPTFATHPIDRWEAGDDPPDVLCVDSEERRIGIELANWLDEEQIAQSIARYRLEHSYLDVIESKRIAPPNNIGLIWLSERPDTKLRQDDAANFRKELVELVADTDRNWLALDDHDNRQVFIRRFPNHPTLAKYLQSLTIFSREHFDSPNGYEWITFPMPGGAYSPQTMVDALLEILRKKTSKYGGLPEAQGLDEFHLIIYYNKALLHNTPFVAPDFGFREVADLAAVEARKNPGEFQSIVLFNATGDERQQESARVWPR